ncbi:MAG TPA: VWA domain-containing protein [Bryobacteraceae bacterium]|nr:VWA domain-containing protein [Bryobacteraceae bacterium]
MRAAVLIVLIVCTCGFAQQTDPNITPRVREKKTADPVDPRKPDIRVDTTLVLIPVAVLDPLRKFVTDLDKENFKIFEDKVEQQIISFSSEDAPLSICIVFDTSGSMGDKLQTSRHAVAQFMKVANPQDEFCMITFNNRPELIEPFTTMTEVIQNRLAFIGSKGSTALLDGVYMAMNQMRKARNPRKAILIISDGGDNASRYTQTEVKNAVVESDVQVYAFGIYESLSSRARTPEEFSGPELLNRLAQLTGGRSFGIGNLAELPDAAEKVAIELRNQYVLGYSPTNKARDGKYRRVEVKMNHVKGLPPLKPIYRTGYYAPLQ